ncbi:MAG: hypothetical protein WBL68_19265, partial [Nitrososphaeraceae archaeon]
MIPAFLTEPDHFQDPQSPYSCSFLVLKPKRSHFLENVWIYYSTSKMGTHLITKRISPSEIHSCTRLV